METSNTSEACSNAQKIQYIKYKEQGYDQKQYELKNSWLLMLHHMSSTT